MKKLFPLLCATALACSACQPTTVINSKSTLQIATSFYPYTFLIERIIGDNATVVQIIPEGTDPHAFELSSDGMKTLYNSAILVHNGLEQEAWVEAIHESLENQQVTIIDASSFVESYLPASTTEYESEGDVHDEHEGESEVHNEHKGESEVHDEHAHGEFDPHIWLDPMAMIQIANGISSQLVQMHPEIAADITSNTQALVTDLEVLDAQLKNSTQNCVQDTIIVSHNAFSYLAARYDFTTEEIQGLSPHSEPTAEKIAELIQLAKEKNLQYIAYETHISPALSEVIAKEAGIHTIVLHSLEARTATEISAKQTYIDLMLQNSANLHTALQCQ